MIIKIDPDIEDLVEFFLEKRRLDYQNLVILLRNKDFDEIAKVCHRISGTALSYGFEKIGTLARDMEMAAIEKQPGIIGEKLIEYDKHLKEVKYECI